MWFACPCLAPLSQNSGPGGAALRDGVCSSPSCSTAAAPFLLGVVGVLGPHLFVFAFVLLYYDPLLTLGSGRITTGFKKESSKGGSGPLNSPLRPPSFCRILLEALGDGQMKKSGPTCHCAVYGVFCSLRPKQWSRWVGVGWG